jgi:hypothetical protein
MPELGKLLVDAGAAGMVIVVVYVMMRHVQKLMVDHAAERIQQHTACKEERQEDQAAFFKQLSDQRQGYETHLRLITDGVGDKLIAIDGQIAYLAKRHDEANKRSSENVKTTREGFAQIKLELEKISEKLP